MIWYQTEEVFCNLSLSDTLVVDARFFHIPDGSTFNALLSVYLEPSEGGTITKNGRKMNHFTQSDKEFLEGKNCIMFENLPYYIAKAFHQPEGVQLSRL